MSTLAFATIVYPRQSVEAGVAAFARYGDCRIASATDETTVVDFAGERTLLRELANFVLEHAVAERV